MKRYVGALFIVLLLFAPFAAFSHEAYVLSREQFQQGSEDTTLRALSALGNPQNLKIAFLAAFGMSILLISNFFFRRLSLGKRLNRFIENFSGIGLIVMRLTLAISLFISSLTGNFLGPELDFQSLPLAGILRVLVLGISICIGLGFFVEIASVGVLVIFGIGIMVFGSYMITYVSYVGVLAALLLLTSRRWSFYSQAVMRIGYGVSIVYTAIAIKLLHPMISVMVVNTYHLNQFHWLFPSDPLLITLGAGLVEAAIGVFIIFGFELRFMALANLFYMTLSLLYFRESVWPHVLLYGIALNLVVVPEAFTLDQVFANFKKKAASS